MARTPVSQPVREPRSREEDDAEAEQQITIGGAIISVVGGMFVEKFHPNLHNIWISIAIAGTATAFFFRRAIHTAIKIVIMAVVICISLGIGLAVLSYLYQQIVSK